MESNKYNGLHLLLGLKHATHTNLAQARIKEEKEIKKGGRNFCVFLLLFLLLLKKKEKRKIREEEERERAEEKVRKKERKKKFDYFIVSLVS